VEDAPPESERTLDHARRVCLTRGGAQLDEAAGIDVLWAAVTEARTAPRKAASVDLLGADIAIKVDARDGVANQPGQRRDLRQRLRGARGGDGSIRKLGRPIAADADTRERVGMELAPSTYAAAVETEHGLGPVR
jgi:hypothetical protein